MIKKGFTFIEVITIMTIIFIMTAVMMTASYKGRDKKEIQAVAREVVASIRETQNNALTGKQKDNDKLSCAFKWAIVRPDSDDKYHAYQMFYSSRSLDEAGCPADDKNSVSTAFQDAISLPKGVTIGTVAYNSGVPEDVFRDHIIFLVPYGKFVVDDGGEASSDVKYDGVDIRIEKDDKKYHICVHSTGLIEEIGYNEDDFACEF
jgi:type II secretory pathway pseudopilin PulG